MVKLLKMIIKDVIDEDYTSKIAGFTAELVSCLAKYSGLQFTLWIILDRTQIVLLR